jgi:hypothetical protein
LAVPEKDGYGNHPFIIPQFTIPLIEVSTILSYNLNTNRMVTAQPEVEDAFPHLLRSYPG